MHFTHQAIVVCLILLLQSTCVAAVSRANISWSGSADSCKTMEHETNRYCVPANITLDVVIDDTSITATMNVQPLDSGDFVVVANRIYPYHPERRQFFFVPKGMHTVIALYDSLRHLCKAWSEPYISDYNESEKYVFGVTSRDRPLSFKYSRVFHEAIDSVEINQFLSKRYACLQGVASFRKELLCRFLPEICAKDPWTYDNVAIMTDREGTRPDLVESPNTKFCMLTMAQYDRIKHSVVMLHNPTANIVTTIRTPLKH